MRIGGKGSAKTDSLQKWLNEREPVRLFPAAKKPHAPGQGKIPPSGRKRGRPLPPKFPPEMKAAYTFLCKDSYAKLTLQKAR
nr:hypothetical protein [Bacillaceae bacterium]